MAYYSLHGFDAHYAVMTHNYHNGICELMLDMGLIGFIISYDLYGPISIAFKHIKTSQ